MLSVILPCYNPPLGWEKNVLNNYLAIDNHIDDVVQLIIVDDGSTSGVTNENISFLKEHITHFLLKRNEQNRGKGFAIRKGVEVADGNTLIYTDIDFPYDIESLLKVYATLKKNEVDIVAGVKDDTYYKNVPFARKYISKGLRLFTKTLLSLPISDTQCGLKGFKKEVSTLFLDTTIDRYLFDIEFLRNAHKKHLHIVQVPVHLNDSVVFRKMNYKILLPEVVNFIKIISK